MSFESLSVHPDYPPTGSAVGRWLQSILDRQEAGPSESDTLFPLTVRGGTFYISGREQDVLPPVESQVGNVLRIIGTFVDQAGREGTRAVLAFPYSQDPFAETHTVTPIAPAD
jgi:hypothetical protein